MLLSKTCTYAIRAAILITTKAMNEKRKFIPIRELSEELGLSFHFLAKIMQSLTEANLVESFKGPNGGVGLSKKAGQTKLIDIVSAIDGTDLFTECALGLPKCGESTPCPLHKEWSKRRESMTKMLSKTSLAMLSRKIQTETLRN